MGTGDDNNRNIGEPHSSLKLFRSSPSPESPRLSWRFVDPLIRVLVAPRLREFMPAECQEGTTDLPPYGVLNLSNCALHSSAFDALLNDVLSQLRGLLWLQLDSNELGDAALSTICEHTDIFGVLRTLDLRGNKIDNAELVLKVIDTFPMLRVFLVSGNALRFPGMVAPIADGFLEGHDPPTLKRMLERLRDDGTTTTFARLTTAGVSGSGKTHYTRRLQLGADPDLDKPIEETDDGQGKNTSGVRTEQVEFRPLDYNVKLPNLRMVVQDVGGHRQQHKAHHHLVYLAGESVFVLCINLKRKINGWPEYYMSMLEDLARRRYCRNTPKKRSDINPGTFPQEDKLRVVVVPTHKDRVKDPRTIEARMRALRSALHKHWMLAPSLCEPTSNLYRSDHERVNTLVARQLASLPGLQQRTLKFVPELCEIVRGHFAVPKSNGTGVKHVTVTVQKIKQWCKDLKGFEVGDLRSAVLELLRLGVAMAPLSHAPEREGNDPVERDIARLLNPEFINKQLYALLMDPKLQSNYGGLITHETLKKRLGFHRDELEVVRTMLEEHLVAFQYSHGNMPAGLLLPDRLRERTKGDFPEPDAEVATSNGPAQVREWNRRLVTFDGFVPEYALFELMRDNLKSFDPIDPERSVFAYRDACQFSIRHYDAGDATTIRVYLDVLKREARMYGRGELAHSQMMHFARKLAEYADCGMTCEDVREHGVCSTVQATVGVEESKGAPNRTFPNHELASTATRTESPIPGRELSGQQIWDCIFKAIEEQEGSESADRCRDELALLADKPHVKSKRVAFLIDEVLQLKHPETIVPHKPSKRRRVYENLLRAALAKDSALRGKMLSVIKFQSLNDAPRRAADTIFLCFLCSYINEPFGRGRGFPDTCAVCEKQMAPRPSRMARPAALYKCGCGKCFAVMLPPKLTNWENKWRLQTPPQCPSCQRVLVNAHLQD